MQSEYFKLKKNLGILPDPYSKRILIFGEKEDEDDYGCSDEDEDKNGMYIYNPDDSLSNVYTKNEYDPKFTFDQQN
eukprot:CAMPEP_0205808330 /NCGR_PEP_ID=MMETSP0205-20121125/12249_1 /ASSEMBLY_ACC=CAM_ASM_000278 /TAXON_ID=36767 /ORGANISM="Euplotes focardii, Strain TN1" /LENGTH=75 /DNA_ID=CAMNT_0053083831 /DNA_START=242 /DNA_END=466 /DNA_ORIENTATION=+